MNSNCLLTNCTLCTLSSSETLVAPLEGQGRATSKYMILTFMPSALEDKERKHFPSDEGILLENMLNCVQLTAKDFYFTTVLKCKADYGIVPSKESVGVCTSTYLQDELEAVKPEYILALGADVGKFMFGDKYSITKERGIRNWKSYTVCMTYHPKYLLRHPTMETNSPKWQAWQDLIEFKDLIDNGVPF